MTSKDDEYDYLFKGIFIRFYFSVAAIPLQTSYILHWTEVLLLPMVCCSKPFLGAVMTHSLASTSFRPIT